MICLHIYVVTGHAAVPAVQGRKSNPLSGGLQQQPVQIPHASETVKQETDDASNQQQTEQPKLVS